MKRKEIRAAARCLQVFRDCKVQLRGNACPGDRLHLELVKEESHTSLGYLSIIGDDTRAQPPEFRFQCSPRDLFAALSLHKGKTITFRFLSDEALLVLQSRDKPVGAHPPMVLETIIRVRPLVTQAVQLEDPEAIVREALTVST